jgi:hypothetical protein
VAHLRQRAGAPVGSIGRSLPSGPAEDLVHLRRQDRAGPPRAWGLFLYTGDSWFDEPLLPQSHGLAGDSPGLGNFSVGLVRGGHSQDLGALHPARSQSTAPGEPLEVVLLFLTQPHLGRSRHCGYPFGPGFRSFSPVAIGWEWFRSSARS